jgi:hypothetical protein
MIGSFNLLNRLSEGNLSKFPVDLNEFTKLSNSAYSLASYSSNELLSNFEICLYRGLTLRARDYFFFFDDFFFLAAIGMFFVHLCQI